jgi:hypothetical protein
MMNHKGWVLSFFALAAASMGVAPLAAQADEMIEITAAQASSGLQVSAGQCPCVRMAVAVQAGGIIVDKKEVLISIEAFKGKATLGNPSEYSKLTSMMGTFAAAEVLSKGGHVGLDFKGVTYGQDRDRGLERVLRTGIYAVANIVQSSNVLLNLEVGDEYEKLTNLNNQTLDRNVIETAAVLKFNSKAWSGNVRAHVGTQADRAFRTNATRFGVSSGVHARLARFGDMLELGAGAEVSYEHDTFRELLGLNADNFVGTLLVDLSVVPSREMSN